MAFSIRCDQPPRSSSSFPHAVQHGSPMPVRPVPEDIVAINGDFHCDFTNSSGMSVWLGAGPAVVMTDPSAGRSNTGVGVNAVVTDQSQVGLSGGVRF